MRIKAAVLRDPDQPYRYEDLDLSGPGPGEVLVEIAGTGLCHTDMALRSPITAIIEGNSVPHLMIPTLIDLWRAGLLPFDRLVTTYPLREINDAEKAAVSGDVVKPVLLPGEPA